MQKLDPVAKRIDWLLEHLWGNNQRAMAAAIGCSQAVLSMIVHGKRPPGRKVVELVASFPRVNPAWLRSGSGEAILAQATLDSLPIAEETLPGPPLENRNLLLGERHPVTPENFGETRYWLRVRRNQPAVESQFVKVRAGDLLLMECDRSKFEPMLQLEGFHGLAAVRLPQQGDGSILRLCRLWLESQSNVNTYFKVDPFDREAKRRQLVRRITTEEYPDGTKRTWQRFKEVAPDEMKRKPHTGPWRTLKGPVSFFRMVKSDCIVAVAIQLVRENP